MPARREPRPIWAGLVPPMPAVGAPAPRSVWVRTSEKRVVEPLKPTVETLAMSLPTTSSISWWLRRPERALDMARIMGDLPLVGWPGSLDPGWMRGGWGAGRDRRVHPCRWSPSVAGAPVERFVGRGIAAAEMPRSGRRCGRGRRSAGAAAVGGGGARCAAGRGPRLPDRLDRAHRDVPVRRGEHELARRRSGPSRPVAVICLALGARERDRLADDGPGEGQLLRDAPARRARSRCPTACRRR